METFVQEIMPAVIQLISVVILGLIGWATNSLKKWLDEKGITEQLEQYDYLADLAVKAVEQIYKNENGTVKKQKAKEYVLDSLDDIGLNITPAQLNMFIESAVKRMNTEWTNPEVIVVEEDKAV